MKVACLLPREGGRTELPFFGEHYSFEPHEGFPGGVADMPEAAAQQLMELVPGAYALVADQPSPKQAKRKPQPEPEAQQQPEVPQQPEPEDLAHDSSTVDSAEPDHAQG